MIWWIRLNISTKIPERCYSFHSLVNIWIKPSRPSSTLIGGFSVFFSPSIWKESNGIFKIVTLKIYKRFSHFYYKETVLLITKISRSSCYTFLSVLEGRQGSFEQGISGLGIQPPLSPEIETIPNFSYQIPKFKVFLKKINFAMTVLPVLDIKMFTQFLVSRKKELVIINDCLLLLLN